MITARTKRIAELNDLARRAMGVACKLMQTEGICALDEFDQSAIREMVEKYNTFETKNDPYGERDFGAINYREHKIFWKIDYYDKTMDRGSEAPEDPGKTTRVLTIMLAEEY